MASDRELYERNLHGGMRGAAECLSRACDWLGVDARRGDDHQLRDELGLLVMRLRRDSVWLRAEASYLESEATRDA